MEHHMLKLLGRLSYQHDGQRDKQCDIDGNNIYMSYKVTKDRPDLAHGQR